jgi:succinoglycan biosynthesis protein ExoL
VRVAFLLPVPVQVRFQKRIRALQALGVEPVVLSFERDYYEGQALPVAYTSLGHISHGSYRQRVRPLLRAVGHVRRALAAVDAIYAFGLDMLGLAVVATAGRRSRAILYEVGDIRDAMVRPGALSTVLQHVERALIRRCSLVVTTSPVYLSEYFVARLGLSNSVVHVIENKVDGEELGRVADRRGDRRIPRTVASLRIGYFGLLRCEPSLRILMRAARTGEGRIEVLARGLPLVEPSLIQEFAATPHVTFDGTFRSPHDLPAMYASVDAVWVGYSGPPHLSNWRWARSNRYYEAAFFKKPMIGAVGTEDGRLIAERGLGLCLDLNNIEKSAAELRAVTSRQLATWRGNVGKLPWESYALDSEHDAVVRVLRSTHK